MSVDIETTGLNIEDCQILEVALVIDDLTKPFRERIEGSWLVNPGEIRGEPYALSMHSELLREIADGKGMLLSRLQPTIAEFLSEVYKINWVGKNAASFDIPFLKKYGIGKLRQHHRVLDIGHLYWDYAIDGVLLPDLGLCCERAGLSIDCSQHRALPDALINCLLLRKKLGC